MTRIRRGLGAVVDAERRRRKPSPHGAFAERDLTLTPALSLTPRLIAMERTSQGEGELSV